MAHDPASPRHTILTGRDQIAFFHLLQLRGALSLECKGIPHSQGSVSKYVQRLFDLEKLSKEATLDHLDEIIEQVRTGELIYELGKGVKPSEEVRHSRTDREG